METSTATFKIKDTIGLVKGSMRGFIIGGVAILTLIIIFCWWFFSEPEPVIVVVAPPKTVFSNQDESRFIDPLKNIGRRR